MEENQLNRYLEIKDWVGKGFSPLTIFGSWLAAKMNWEERFDPANLSVLERHNGTDEVFILWRGSAALMVKTDRGIEAREMVPGVFYNVIKGVWHNVLGSKDASWIIVETHDPHAEPTEFYQLREDEKTEIRKTLAGWLARNS
ncbi:MAG: hypothetical protein EHM70_10435 [Chloroflexota bacterium]|nr:MAG: hypothetical protein EHM70_10435 [Chloroflexota bacterium]